MNAVLIIWLTLIFISFLSQEDDDDLKDDEFYEDQLNEQTFSQENSGSHHLTGKHDMNFVLGGQGIEGEPFIDLSPIDISGQCDETYMRLTSMKQERSKVMSGQHSVIFGMKAGDGSDISVWFVYGFYDFLMFGQTFDGICDLLLIINMGFYHV